MSEFRCHQTWGYAKSVQCWLMRHHDGECVGPHGEREPRQLTYRCLRCGDFVQDHRVDDEERRECNLCECKQYEAPR